jgi:ArsR family transcriptional regulator, nickel/cobalt-responsive transcriptional repressor
MNKCDGRYAAPVGHGTDASTALDAATAKAVATTLQALAAPSRLMILSRLRERPMTVGELVESVDMEQPAVSHQLRLLRNLGLVDSERHGRNVVYTLFDDHVAELIEQAVYHAEHLRLGLRDRD